MRPSLRYGDTLHRALDTWVKLARSFATMNHLSSDQIRGSGLTLPQFGVLECLGHKGPLTQGELSRKQLASGGNMTVVVDNLERDGLVERGRSDLDRRQVRVRLTPKGEELFQQVFLPHAEFIGECLSVLTPEEQTQLGVLLKKLGVGLSEKTPELVAGIRATQNVARR